MKYDNLLLLIICADCTQPISKGEGYWSIDGNYYHLKCIHNKDWNNNDSNLMTIQELLVELFPNKR